jgi:branched-chain amino acid transport system permease protein
LTAEQVSSGQRAVNRLHLEFDRRTIVSVATAFALILFAILALPALFGSDWITTFTSVAIYSIVALGFGLLYGRVGMISLGQIAFLSLGVWVGTRLAYATSIPFPLLLIVTGAVVMVIGTLVGLTAIRLSGLYLALITLMFAGATQIVLSVWEFPNGGGGFTGHTYAPDLSGLANVRRPEMAVGSTAYYRYVIVVAVIIFVLVLIHLSSKPGRAWASIRESEPAALAAGVNITLYKMWAFALASFMTGVAGCLLAALNGVSRAINFQTQDSLTLAATSLIGGIFSVWGAVIAGTFNQLFPFLFGAQWSVNPNFLLVVFGAGLLQVLLSAPGGLVDQFPKDMANLGRLITGKVPLTRQAALGIGSIVALILGIVLLATVTPIVGLVVVILSPVLAAYSLD